MFPDTEMRSFPVGERNIKIHNDFDSQMQKKKKNPLICGSFSNAGSLLKNSQLIIFFCVNDSNLTMRANSPSNTSDAKCRQV